jgi:hypothetical protein
MKRLSTLKLFQIVRTEIKKSKTYSGRCPFQGLSIDIALMQIQSGRTVLLKGIAHEIRTTWKFYGGRGSRNACFLVLKLHKFY